MSIPHAHRVALASRLNSRDLADDLTARETYILGRYGVWLQGLAEKTLEPITERQKAFAYVMDREDDGADEFEKAWKAHAVSVYARLLTQLIERQKMGGEGYGNLKETLWVPSGSAKWERFGFTLTQPEKDFFHRLEGECEDRFGFPALIWNPAGVFQKLLELCRSETVNPTKMAERLIETLVVPHVAIFDDHEESSSNGTIADDGWLEKYCATNGLSLPCDEGSNDLLRAISPDDCYEYVLPEQNVHSFVVEYLTILTRAGPYGRKSIRKLFSQQLDARSSAFNSTPEDWEDDRHDSWESIAVGTTPRSPDFDPDDLDDYDYIQDRIDLEDPPELDEST